MTTKGTDWAAKSWQESRRAPGAAPPRVGSVINPLGTPLTDWTQAEALALVGAPESDRLEFKSYRLDVSDRDNKVKLAREVAAMATESGGFIVLGSDDGDELHEFRGHGVGDHGALARALRDLVRPAPIIKGPREFVDEQGQTILVFEVVGHPLGIPHSVDGAFYVRTGESSNPMAPDDVARRFAAIDSLRSRARDAAETLVDHPERTAYVGGLRGEVRSWLTIAVVPSVLTDHGLSGRALRDAIEVAAEAETQLSTELLGTQGDRLLHDFPAASRMTSRGVQYRDVRSAVEVEHDGSVVIAVDLANFAGVPGDHSTVHVDHLELTATRLMGLIWRMHRAVGVAVPAAGRVVSLVRGMLRLPEPTADGRVAYSPRQMNALKTSLHFDLLLGRSGAAMYDDVHLFAQRVVDSSEHAPIGFAEVEAHRRYLEQLTSTYAA